MNAHGRTIAAWCLRTLTLGLAVLSPVSSSVSQESKARIQWTDLPADLPASLRDSMRFGYFEVPADHDDPRGRRIRLAIALLPALSPNAAPDPLVFMYGGPGLAAILTNAASFARLEQYRLYRQGRDIVILDQRGHGYSEPRTCERLGRNRGDSDAAEQAYLARLADCRARLLSEGVRLETLSAIQAARDLEWLRLALGASRLNLYGASYGTRIALEAMRQVPATLRAVHLSAVVRPGRLGVADADTAVANEALAALFRRCAAQADCRNAFPRLEAEFDSVMARARRAPWKVAVPSNLDPDGELVLEEPLLRFGLAQSLANREAAARLPHTIHIVAGQGFEGLTDLASQIARGGGAEGRIARGTLLAFWCNDGAVSAASSPRLQRQCRALMGEDWAGREAQSVRSDIPTLVTTGELDPRTPPSYAQAVAAGLSRSHLVIIPSHGHERQPACLFSISRAFLDAPERAPAIACLDSVPPIEFFKEGMPDR